MLVIRLVRTGKKHQAYFRIAVADSRKSPTAKFVEILGNYDPHAKKLVIEKDRLDLYMKNGAQPSNSVAKLLKSEKISLPKWVKITEKKRAAKKKEEPKPTAPAASQDGEKPAETEEVKSESTETPTEAPVENESSKEVKPEDPAVSEGEVPTKESKEENAEK